MVQLLGPDENGRLAYAVQSGMLRAGVGKTATIFLDSLGTQLAAINEFDPNNPTTPGSLIPGSVVTVDVYSKLPLFWFPDGVTTLYASSGGGPLVALNPDLQSQITTTSTDVSTALATANSAATGASLAQKQAFVAMGYRGTGMVPVASGTNTNPAETSQWLTYGSQFSRLHHVATADIVAIRLVYWNGINSSNDPVNEIANANQISVRASVEVGNGGLAPYRFTSNSTAYNAATTYVVGDQVTSGGAEWVCIQAGTGQTPATGSAFWQQILLYPVHFSGETSTRDATLQGGQIAISDPIYLVPGLSKGQVFYTRTYVQPNNGTANTGNTPRTWYGYAASGFYGKHSSSGTAGTDFTLTGPTGLGDADNTASFGPVAIIGIPKDPTKSMVFVLGDSIMFGTGETSAFFGDEFPGYVLRLLADNATNATRYNYGFVRSAKGSETSFVVGGVGFSVRLGLATACTHAVDELIVNDIGTSKTLAQIQAAAVARWNALAAAGLKVYAATSTPRTTSTDNWATVQNQTPAANFGVNSKWSQYNDWLRTVPAPLTGVIDAAAAVTDASGTVWQPAYVYTGDGLGLHPSTAGSIQIATASPLYLATNPSTPVTINPTLMFGPS